MPETMNNSLALVAALLASLAGLGWLALAMEAHWEQVCGAVHLTPATRRGLRVAGGVALGVSLLLCLKVDHASMAVLVWVMSLAAAALLLAFTLAWRARWLRPLVPWVRQPG